MKNNDDLLLLIRAPDLPPVPSILLRDISRGGEDNHGSVLWLLVLSMSSLQYI